MRPSLRNKYFGWLVILILFSYLLFAGILLAFNRHETVEHGDTGEEREELFALMGMMLLTLPVVVFTAWAIAGKLLQPLNQIVITSERIRRGNLAERNPPMARRDELARLAETINEAFDRYAVAVRRLEAFSADAAHQLRTPLAAIRSTAEVALQSKRDENIYQEILGDILTQTGKLQQTMEQLLLLSRLERSMRDQFTGLSLATEVNDWIEETKPALEAIHLTLTTELPESVRVLGNAILLREVFNNLINNAVSFTPEGGTIAISLRERANHKLEWRLEDSGPGIPPADRERVFDRFFRGSSSGYPGSGLGLAIVREIILLHGGMIRIESSKSLGGAAIVMELPITVP